MTEYLVIIVLTVFPLISLRLSTFDRVQAIFPSTDHAALKDLVACARKVEGDMYDTANSSVCIALYINGDYSHTGLLLIYCKYCLVLLYEKFEETKGVIRSCKSKKDRQYNGQKKNDKKANEWSTKNYTEAIFALNFFTYMSECQI